MVDAAPRYSGPRRGEAGFRARGAAAGNGAAGSRRPAGSTAGAPVVDSLGLARRAGLAVAGFDRVSDAVRHGRAALLLFALDGADGGRRKLAALGRDLPWAAVLTAAELGAAFGRDRIVHAAVGGGTLCRRLLLDLEKLAGLRVAAPGADEPAAVDDEFKPEAPAEEKDGIEAHD